MNQISPEVRTVTLTPSAAARVRVLAEGEGNPNLMLRVAVSGGGCSGYSYGFSLDSEITADDKIFECNGAKLVVDDVSLDLLKDSHVDYVDDLTASSFRITNPHATSTCGCGTSFSL